MECDSSVLRCHTCQFQLDLCCNKMMVRSSNVSSFHSNIQNILNFWLTQMWSNWFSGVRSTETHDLRISLWLKIDPPMTKLLSAQAAANLSPVSFIVTSPCLPIIHSSHYCFLLSWHSCLPSKSLSLFLLYWCTHMKILAYTKNQYEYCYFGQSPILTNVAMTCIKYLLSNFFHDGISILKSLLKTKHIYSGS